jgi:5-methylcytosine-specific restriction protein A
MPKRPPIHRPYTARAKPRDPRPSAAKRGYNWRWRNENGTGAADQFLRDHPLCAECQRQGLLTAATCVDHVIPHRGNQELFWEALNWEALCAPCHSAKTARGQ